ncbi:MAG: glucose-1-phosphate adenylyltransferase, partial [Verrucomicrobiota bacterium]
FDPSRPIYTNARYLPTSKINNAVIQSALIADGCIISNATIRRSIVGVRTVIESGSDIHNCVIMGADYYTEKQVGKDGEIEHTPIKIGSNCMIRKAIIDKNAIIGNNVVIDPGDRIDEDNEWCHIRDGVVVIPKGKVIPDNTIV